MNIVKNHRRIPGQMLETTSPISASRYLELERRLEQDEELDSRAKKILRTLIKAIGGLGALSASILGIGSIINMLKSADKSIEEVEKEVGEVIDALKGIPKESDDVRNASQYLKVDPVELFQKLDKGFSRAWMDKVFKRKRSMTGYEYIPVSRKEKGRIALQRLILKRHYGGYTISYDPQHDLVLFGKPDSNMPTPLSRDVYNLAGDIKKMKSYAEHAFSRSPGLKDTPVHKSYLKVVKEVDQVLSRKHQIGSMNIGELTRFALELSNLRDILKETIKDDTALMNLFQSVEKEMKEKSLQRERLISRWGIRDIPTTVEEIKREKPHLLKQKMEQLHVLLGKKASVDGEARLLMRELEVNINSIGQVQQMGSSFMLPKIDQKLLSKYASDLTHVKDYANNKLLPTVIGEAAAEVDRSLIESIRTSLPYQGKVVMF